MVGMQEYDKNTGNYSLADLVRADLKSHTEKDEIVSQSIFHQIETMSQDIKDIRIDIKDINKWIWIATGVMLALSKGIDFIAQKHGL